MAKQRTGPVSPSIKQFPLAGLLLAAFTVSAQQAVYESEPNSTPAEANRIAGEVAVFGTMVEGDQDGFKWTVSDDDARRVPDRDRLHGRPEGWQW